MRCENYLLHRISEKWIKSEPMVDFTQNYRVTLISSFLTIPRFLQFFAALSP